MKKNEIFLKTVLLFLPENRNENNSPVIFENKSKSDLSEREILYKVLFDMKRDLTELKKITFDLINNEENSDFNKEIFNDVNENEITLIPKQKESDSLEEVYTLT